MLSFVLLGLATLAAAVPAPQETLTATTKYIGDPETTIITGSSSFIVSGTDIIESEPFETNTIAASTTTFDTALSPTTIAMASASSFNFGHCITSTVFSGPPPGVQPTDTFYSLPVSIATSCIEESGAPTVTAVASSSPAAENPSGATTTLSSTVGNSAETTSAANSTAVAGLADNSGSKTGAAVKITSGVGLGLVTVALSVAFVI